MNELSLNFKVMRYMLQKIPIFYQKNAYVSAECRAHYQYIKLYTRHEKKDSQFLLLVRMYCGLHEAHVYEREDSTQKQKKYKKKEANKWEYEFMNFTASQRSLPCCRFGLLGIFAVVRQKICEESKQSTLDKDDNCNIRALSLPPC